MPDIQAGPQTRSKTRQGAGGDVQANTLPGDPVHRPTSTPATNTNSLTVNLIQKARYSQSVSHISTPARTNVYPDQMTAIQLRAYLKEHGVDAAGHKNVLMTKHTLHGIGLIDHERVQGLIDEGECLWALTVPVLRQRCEAAGVAASGKLKRDMVRDLLQQQAHALDNPTVTAARQPAEPPRPPPVSMHQSVVKWLAQQSLYSPEPVRPEMPFELGASSPGQGQSYDHSGAGSRRSSALAITVSNPGAQSSRSTAISGISTSRGGGIETKMTAPRAYVESVPPTPRQTPSRVKFPSIHEAVTAPLPIAAAIPAGAASAQGRRLREPPTASKGPMSLRGFHSTGTSAGRVRPSPPAVPTPSLSPARAQFFAAPSNPSPTTTPTNEFQLDLADSVELLVAAHERARTSYANQVSFMAAQQRQLMQTYVDLQSLKEIMDIIESVYQSLGGCKTQNDTPHQT